jgi:hypothetical protein
VSKERGRRQTVEERTAHLENLIILGRAVHRHRRREIQRSYVLLTGVTTDRIPVIRIDR